MSKISELQEERGKKVDEQKKLMNRKDRENRLFTLAEDAQYETFETDIKALDRKILIAQNDQERQRVLATREIELRSTAPAIIKAKEDGVADVNPEREFRGLAEVFYSIAREKRDGVRDERLGALLEQREMILGSGPGGGYAVPERFLDELQRVQAGQAVVRGRARVLTPGHPPDSILRIPALDQRAQKNWHGGVVLYRTGEGAEMTESSASLREITLEPREVSGYVVITNRLLNNWKSADQVVTSLLTSAMVATEDGDYINGNGVARPLGYLNSAAALSYNRDTAGTIKFADVLGMAALLLRRGGAPCWVASPTAIPQLGSMVDAGSNSVWLGGVPLGGAAAALPGSLLGMPVILSERVPPIGTRGDLSLCDFSYYLCLLGSGPFIGSSEHVLYTSNRTIFKLVWHYDGHSWIDEPLPLEADPTRSISPFVVLQ